MVALRKIHTDLNDKLFKTIDDHSYPPEKENIEVREKAKQRAINEKTPIPRIYDEECEKAKLTNATIAIIPSERENAYETCSIDVLDINFYFLYNFQTME